MIAGCGTSCWPAHVRLSLAGGGREYFANPDAQGVYPMNPRSGAVLVRVSTDPIRYERRLPDHRVEVYGQPDGGLPGQRRVFLTEVRDARGQALTFTWDVQSRLVAVTDALGQVTTLQYADAADPLRVTSVTDPFGRSATFTYTGAGQLSSVTDTLGLTSTFGYQAEDFVGALTTPYGTTTFRHETDRADFVNNPMIEAIDPTGASNTWSITSPRRRSRPRCRRRRCRRDSRRTTPISTTGTRSTGTRRRGRLDLVIPRRPR